MPSHQYTKRLQRLLTLVNEIKTNPRQVPEALYTALGVSAAMFYKDRQTLTALGFVFHYDRRQRQYTITQDQFLPVLNLSTSEVLALIMAVQQLSSSGDYTLTYDAIVALGKIIVSDHGVEHAGRDSRWVIQRRAGNAPVKRPGTASTRKGQDGRSRMRQVCRHDSPHSPPRWPVSRQGP